MEKMLTGRVLGGRLVCRIFAQSWSKKLYFRFRQTSTNESSSFYVLNLINKLMTSHNAPTINVNEVSCVVKRVGALVEIL